MNDTEAPTTIEAMVRDRVSAGAAWLDSVAPGWREHVQPLSVDDDGPYLNMMNCDGCVLAQVALWKGWKQVGDAFASPYHAGMEQAGYGWGSSWGPDAASDWSNDHGFNVTMDDRFRFAGIAGVLSDAWMAELAK